MRNLITDVPGISVGNAEDHEALTGVTVILPDRRSVCAVDSRGGAPGTRETDALSPACLVDAVDAVVLSGGSVYGLDAASGVTAWLGARGRGFLVHEAAPRSPIVPAAILYDPNNGGSKDWGGQPPYAGLGKEACAAAVAAEFALGNAGAGLGALAGALKGGLGSASAQTSGGITVGALVAVNAFGSAVVPGASAFWAAPFERDGEFGGKSFGDHRIEAAEDIVWDGAKGGHAGVGSNTTIGVVAADVRLSPAEAQRLAIMAQDGFSRSLRSTRRSTAIRFLPWRRARERSGTRRLSLWLNWARLPRTRSRGRWRAAFMKRGASRVMSATGTSTPSRRRRSNFARRANPRLAFVPAKH